MLSIVLILGGVWVGTFLAALDGTIVATVSCAEQPLSADFLTIAIPGSVHYRIRVWQEQSDIMVRHFLSAHLLGFPAPLVRATVLDPERS